MPGLGRRAFMLSAPVVVATATAKAASKLDGLEWNANFRQFIKQFNRFLEALNDGVFDAKGWKRVQQAWKDLDKDTCGKSE